MFLFIDLSKTDLTYHKLVPFVICFGETLLNQGPFEKGWKLVVNICFAPCPQEWLETYSYC
jgi:hypothetical protein